MAGVCIMALEYRMRERRRRKQAESCWQRKYNRRRKSWKLAGILGVRPHYERREPASAQWRQRKRREESEESGGESLEAKLRRKPPLRDFILWKYKTTKKTIPSLKTLKYKNKYHYENLEKQPTSYTYKLKWENIRKPEGLPEERKSSRKVKKNWSWHGENWKAT